MPGATLVWIESPSNPGLDVLDVAALAAEAHAAARASRSTTRSPARCGRPLDAGADWAVMSASKHITGHSDLVLGYVATRDPERAAALRTWRGTTGAIPGPFEAWLAHRSLATYAIRLERQERNAAAVAELLRARDDAADVRWPGVGSVVCFTLESAERAQAFIAASALVSEATSFGGLHTSAERRARWGTDDVAEGGSASARGSRTPRTSSRTSRPRWTAREGRRLRRRPRERRCARGRPAGGGGRRGRRAVVARRHGRVGPDAARAVALVRSCCAVALIGNHDRDEIAAGALDGSEDLAWMRARKPAARRAGVQCWHGSPRHPVHEYVTAANAATAWAASAPPSGSSGTRTRRPRGGRAADAAPTGWLSRSANRSALAGAKWLLNPGAVGGVPRRRGSEAAWRHSARRRLVARARAR